MDNRDVPEVPIPSGRADIRGSRRIGTHGGLPSLNSRRSLPIHKLAHPRPSLRNHGCEHIPRKSRHV